MQLLLAIPNFDDGHPLNWGMILARDSAAIPRERIPMMVMQSNLWGRSVLASVLREELKRTYDALDRELKTVGEIQRSLLPAALPIIPSVDLAVHYETSQRAGGDYYDFFPLPENKWGVLIADVSGHGIPAAVVMAITHAIAHTRPSPMTHPKDLLGYMNTTLRNRYLGETGSFVTGFYAVYDPATRALIYAGAGHPKPRLARDGKVTELQGRFGLPLGIDTPTEYQEYEIELQRGDELVLYTDGVNEAFDSSGAQFGTDPIDAAMLRSRGDATKLLKTILAELKQHSGDRSAKDDRTLLAMCLK
jgi:sigma-B regulation protein RsbU (phosphoserine phosphatase)